MRFWWLLIAVMLLLTSCSPGMYITRAEAQKYPLLLSGGYDEGQLYYAKGIVRYGFEYSGLTLYYTGFAKDIPIEDPLRELPWAYVALEGKALKDFNRAAKKGAKQMNRFWGAAFVEGLFVRKGQYLELVKLVMVRPISPDEWVDLKEPTYQ